jgi:D-amino-acid oxidase
LGFLNRGSVSEKGSEAAEWDRKTWYYLKDLAENHSDAGIQFRSTLVNDHSQTSGLIGL